MLRLYRCSEVTEPYRSGVLIRPAIHRHVKVWTNFQNPARHYQHVLAEGTDAQLDQADLDPACHALSPRVADREAFGDWLAKPVGGTLSALKARCEQDGIPAQDLAAGDTNGKALRRILRTHEVSQSLWGLRKTPAFAAAIELLKADQSLKLAELPPNVMRRARTWFAHRDIDVSDLDETTPVWVLVRRVCDVLVTQTKYGNIDPTDTFTRANETPLGAPDWESGPGAWGDLNLNTNAVRLAASSIDSAARYTTNFSLNHFSEVTISAFTAVSVVGSNTRMRTDADGDGYRVYVVSDPETGMQRVDDTGTLAFVALGGTGLTLAAINDVIRMESNGTSHTAKLNGSVLHGPQTDATYNTGGTHVRVGFSLFDFNTASAEITAWQGGDLVAAGGFIPIIGRGPGMALAGNGGGLVS